MSLLSWCGIAAVSAAALVVFAAVQPRQMGLRVIWSVLLVLGEVLPLVLLCIAWWRTRFVIPFLGPPVRFGMLPVWWALAAVVLGYIAAAIDISRVRAQWWLVVLPPVHGVAALLRMWR